MKAATAIGIGAGVAALLLASMMEGTQPMAFFNIPALIIVLVGTGAATLSSVGIDTMKRIPAMYKLAFGPPELDVPARVAQIVSIAEQARREGLLALDGQLASIEDPFTRKGLQLVVDGTDPDLVREVLEAEMDGMATRHAAGATAFEKAGGYAPTMGIIGTVMGLVHVLQNLAAPSTLGPAISTAFIATLMGVGAANLIFLPVASRLRALSNAEAELRMLTLEGILAVQAGDNPRVVAERLSSLLPPAERDGAEGEDAARPAVAPAPVAEAA